MSKAPAARGASIGTFMDPDLIFFIYFRNDPVGIGLILPDINPLLKRLDGGTGLRALWKIFAYRKEIVGLRGLLFGVKKEYQWTGVPLLVLDYLPGIMKRKGYRYIEPGWNLEDNVSINQAYEDGGLEANKNTIS